MLLRQFCLEIKFVDRRHPESSVTSPRNRRSRGNKGRGMLDDSRESRGTISAHGNADEMLTNVSSKSGGAAWTKVSTDTRRNMFRESDRGAGPVVVPANVPCPTFERATDASRRVDARLEDARSNVE